MSIKIRKAKANDQKIIGRIVREARLNPLGLDWPNFLIAELDETDIAKHDEKIVGVGQVKAHRDGSRELASIVVLPGYRRQGVARNIIEKLLAREEGTVYLVCAHELEAFYRRFGFRKAQREALSRSMNRIQRTGDFFTRLVSLFGKRKVRIIAMKREESGTNSS